MEQNHIMLFAHEHPYVNTLLFAFCETLVKDQTPRCKKKQKTKNFMLMCFHGVAKRLNCNKMTQASNNNTEFVHLSLLIIVQYKL